LTGIRAKVKELQDKVAALEESFMKATEDKNAAIAQVRRPRGFIAGVDKQLVCAVCACCNAYARWAVSQLLL
jgi:hypothetical protein